MGFLRRATLARRNSKSAPSLPRSLERQQAEYEIHKRRGKSATYTQPLEGATPAQQADIDSFLAEFYSRTIFERSSEMQRLLQEYPETLGTHYAVLVPRMVSFDAFWSRYWYRCSLTTVLAEQQHIHEQENAEPPVAIVNAKGHKDLQRELRREIQEGLNVSCEHQDGTGSSPGRLRGINRRKKQKQPRHHTAETTGLGDLFDDDIVETIAEEEDEIAFAALG